MPITEHPNAQRQSGHPIIASDTERAASTAEEQETSPVGRLLKNLRGRKTLRQVEADTGIANTYLCKLELGLKRPGTKTLSKLSAYYGVPLSDLLQSAGLTDDAIPVRDPGSIIDVQRGYGFVIADPTLSGYGAPSEEPPLDVQRFVIQMYQHYTGKKLL